MATGYSDWMSNDYGNISSYIRYYYYTEYNPITNASYITIVPQLYSSSNLGSDIRMHAYVYPSGTLPNAGIRVDESTIWEFIGGYGGAQHLNCSSSSWTNMTPNTGYPLAFVRQHNNSGDVSVKLGIVGAVQGEQYDDSDQSIYNWPTGVTTVIHEDRSLNVSYNANGGSGAPSPTYFYGTTESITLSASTPTRTGYTFAGWNTKSDGTGTSYSAGQNIGTRTSSLTLYAKWTKNSYTVTLTAGDYIASVSGGGSKLYDSSVTVTATLSSATGYTTVFDGWYNGSTKVSSSLSYTFIMGASDVSLIAKGKRTINSYTVSVSAGSNIASVSGGGTKNYGSNVIVSAVLGSATGYTYSFDGWYNGTTRVSTSLSYSFTLGAANISLTAKANRSVNSYNLSISQGTGSTIVVNRTSSPLKGAATGVLSNGSTIYYGDVLAISISANTGYNIGTHTVNGSNWTSGNYTVTGAVSVISTATLITYILSVTTSPSGVTTNIQRLTSPIGGGSTGTIINGATLYYNDTLAIGYTVGGAYQLLTATVNNIDISEQALPYNVTVNNNIVVSVTVKLGAIIYIANEAYQIFIGDGTNWNQYQAFIGNGSEFDQY